MVPILLNFLLEKEYDVYGIIRRSAVDYRERSAHLEGIQGRGDKEE